MRKPLLALAVAAFGIGTTEFIIMGLLPDLAKDFNVSIPKAGTLVSAYALAVTIGSPLLVLALAKVDRKRALMLLMGLFVMGNAACALAPTFGLLLSARILTALMHGVFLWHWQHCCVQCGSARAACAGRSHHVQRTDAG